MIWCPAPTSLAPLQVGTLRKSPARLRLPSRRVTSFQPLLFTEAHREKFQRSRRHQTVQQFKRFVENYRRHIGCVAVFYAIAAALFLERAHRECGCARQLGRGLQGEGRGRGGA